jgi:hypothetical protein
LASDGSPSPSIERGIVMRSIQMSVVLFSLLVCACSGAPVESQGAQPVVGEQGGEVRTQKPSEKSSYSNTLPTTPIATATALSAEASDRPPETVTLTADELTGERRKVLDLTTSTRWIIDGVRVPVDLERIEVQTPTERVALGSWLARESNLSASTMESLGRSRFVLEVGGSRRGGGSPGNQVDPQGGVMAAPCTANICCGGDIDCSQTDKSNCCVWHPRPQP